MENSLRWLAVGALSVAVLGTVVQISSRRPKGPGQAGATDTSVTTRSITYFEAKLAANPHNYMVANRVINRRILRFGTGADMADIARAEEVARDLVERGPDRGPALSRLSSVLLTQHKFSEALSSARAAVELNPTDQDGLGALFEAAMAAGAYGQAEDALGRLTPGILPTEVRRAQWLDAQGKSDGAFAEMDRVCRQMERSQGSAQALAWCLTQLATIEHGRRGPAAAQALLERALVVLPNYRGALEGLATLAYAHGDLAKAESLYKRIVADAHPDLYVRLSDLAAARGDRAAETRYRERFLAISRQAKNEALFGNVLALYYAGRDEPGAKDTALALAQRDFERRPTNESSDLLAWVRFQRGELKAAVAASDYSLRWGSPSPTMLYHRARILEAVGRTTDASRLLHEVSARPTLLAPHARSDWARRSALE